SILAPFFHKGVLTGKRFHLVITVRRSVVYVRWGIIRRQTGQGYFFEWSSLSDTSLSACRFFSWNHEGTNFVLRMYACSSRSGVTMMRRRSGAPCAEMTKTEIGMKA